MNSVFLSLSERSLPISLSTPPPGVPVALSTPGPGESLEVGPIPRVSIFSPAVGARGAFIQVHARSLSTAAGLRLPIMSSGNLSAPPDVCELLGYMVGADISPVAPLVAEEAPQQAAASADAPAASAPAMEIDSMSPEEARMFEILFENDDGADELASPGATAAAAPAPPSTWRAGSTSGGGDGLESTTVRSQGSGATGDVAQDCSVGPMCHSLGKRGFPSISRFVWASCLSPKCMLAVGHTFDGRCAPGGRPTSAMFVQIRALWSAELFRCCTFLVYSANACWMVFSLTCRLPKLAMGLFP